MADLLLNLQNILLTFGGRPVLDHAELMLHGDDRMCLVGRNGSGKSTLLKIAAGLVEQDGGTRFLQPGTTVRYLPQEPDFAGFDTVQAYVEAGLGPTDDPYRARHYLNELGLTGEENPTNLSGGEMRRAALARTLAPEPDVLLLDEPTNHLDLPAIEWLEEELKSLRSAFILISHDRRFLERLSNRTIWLDRGETRRLNQGFAFFEEWRDKVLEEEEIAQSKLAQRIATEEHWMRYGVTARRKRNMRRVALLGSLRKERKEYVGQQGVVKLAASSGELGGRLVFEAEKLNKSFGDRTIVANLNLLLLRGDRLAIVGPNGAGKTTLIKLITGALEADSGAVKRGTNLQVVTLDQSRASLDPNDIVQDVITAGRGQSVTVNGETKHVVTYMQDFLFRPEQARTPVSVLSGGERARLILARELAKPSNVLVLDEPTNDLDLETLDLLQEMLDSYKGTVLLVSHDRDFLDKLATSVLMYEGEGKWVEYAGGYSDMLAQRGAGVEVRKIKAEPKVEKPKAEMPAAPAAAQPKRKLSFKEKYALESLPARMESLKSELAKLEHEMSDATLFTRDPARFEKVSIRQAAAHQELDDAENQWLELEILKEELAG
ncbi:ABC-F family ATP-binding cassette domain-containing protein [Aestuariivirga litoralis]|uniref:ABC-F family ATP-binding cassette domain-containing protein n=1 Tax=Aestuariivirga litoralis TaxID=2650924 RepID=UPI0018C803E2|nr:ATP-binding cassette domain-containing protein [Aestuariivirga litoralis]MBG1232536.1 ATP-binding cassette domain-containing protein [Aestuariivirga litoralis]